MERTERLEVNVNHFMSSRKSSAGARPTKGPFTSGPDWLPPNHSLPSLQSAQKNKDSL